MSPNIQKGDFIFVDREVNAPGSKRQLKRGDTAVFINPNDRTTIFIKRIIGLPGDQIEIDGTDVRVNGKLLKSGESTVVTEKLLFHENSETGQSYDIYWKEIKDHGSISVKVPAGQVFVLGDNRDESYDSRAFGPLPLIDIIGVAKQSLFSTGSDGLRLGKWIDVN